MVDRGVGRRVYCGSGKFEVCTMLCASIISLSLHQGRFVHPSSVQPLPQHRRHHGPTGGMYQTPSAYYEIIFNCLFRSSHAGHLIHPHPRRLNLQAISRGHSLRSRPPTVLNRHMHTRHPLCSGPNLPFSFHPWLHRSKAAP